MKFHYQVHMTFTFTFIARVRLLQVKRSTNRVKVWRKFAYNHWKLITAHS